VASAFWLSIQSNLTSLSPLVLQPQQYNTLHSNDIHSCSPPAKLALETPVMSQEEKTENNSNKRPGSEPSLLLVNGDLWEKFHREDNEMIITKSGRCLFPLLQFKAVDLDPDTMYSIDVDFEMLDHRRYRFVDGTWKCAQPWKKSASEVDEDENENDDGDEGDIHFPLGLQGSYTHPDLCQLGAHWMQKTISFSKIKLTNRIPEARVRTQKRSKHPPATSNHIFHMTSFHRYRPRVHLVQRSDQRRSVVASTTFTFDRTAFMAVTHYQNFRVNDLKKGYNPHAKGFRDTIQLWPSGPRTASISADSSMLSQYPKHSRSYPVTDSGSEGEDTVRDENDEEGGISKDLDMKLNPFPVDGSDSRVVNRSRAKQVIDGNRATATDRELDSRAIKFERHERTPSATRRVSTPDQEESKDNAEHTLQTSSQTLRSELDHSYDMVSLTTFHQRSRTRSSSRKSKLPSALHTQEPARATRSRRTQTYTRYGATAYGAPLFRQPYLAADVQKAYMLPLTAPLTPMPEPISPLELQLSPPSHGKPVSLYGPQAGEAEAYLPTGSMASPAPTSWYQQFFHWDQPSPSQTLPSRTPDVLSTQSPCLLDSSTPLPLQLHSGQTGQGTLQQGFPSGSIARSDIQSQPPSLDANACLISKSFAGPDARAIPCTPDLSAFSYDGDQLAFNYAQTDTCHIWPSILESKTVMSTSSVFSILPYYDGPEKMNLDMVLQENLRLKAFIRERYGMYCKRAVFRTVDFFAQVTNLKTLDQKHIGSEAEAEANAVMVMGRHH